MLERAAQLLQIFRRGEPVRPRDVSGQRDAEASLSLIAEKFRSFDCARDRLSSLFDLLPL